MSSIANYLAQGESAVLDGLQNVLLAALSPDRDQQKTAETQINVTMKEENGYGRARA